MSKGTRWGLGLLSFQAVGREGLETMVFTLAIIFASDRQAASPVHGKLLLIGAALGLAVALGVAFAIYKLGAKLNLRRFFQVLGILLMVFAAGLLADAIENMQQLHWLDFGRHVLWNTRARFQRRRVSATSFIPYSATQINRQNCRRACGSSIWSSAQFFSFAWVRAVDVADERVTVPTW